MAKLTRIQVVPVMGSNLYQNDSRYCMTYVCNLHLTALCSVHCAVCRHCLDRWVEYFPERNVGAGFPRTGSAGRASGTPDQKRTSRNADLCIQTSSFCIFLFGIFHIEQWTMFQKIYLGKLASEWISSTILSDFWRFLWGAKFSFGDLLTQK